MAEEKKRDLKREWQLEKERTKGRESRVVVKIDTSTNEAFMAKCELNGTNRNAVLKRYIERYTYENFDQTDRD